MRLFELFNMGDEQQPMHIEDMLKDQILDILTPLVAHRVPYVTVQKVIDELREIRSGMSVDRALVMNLLDPDKVKMIKKIEGDKIYLSQPVSDERKTAEEDKEKEREQVKKKAAAQATKEVTSDGPPLP